MASIIDANRPSSADSALPCEVQVSGQYLVFKRAFQIQSGQYRDIHVRMLNLSPVPGQAASALFPNGALLHPDQIEKVQSIYKTALSSFISQFNRFNNPDQISMIYTKTERDEQSMAVIADDPKATLETIAGRHEDISSDRIVPLNKRLFYGKSTYLDGMRDLHAILKGAFGIAGNSSQMSTLTTPTGQDSLSAPQSKGEPNKAEVSGEDSLHPTSPEGIDSQNNSNSDLLPSSGKPTFDQGILGTQPQNQLSLLPSPKKAAQGEIQDSDSAEKLSAAGTVADRQALLNPLNGPPHSMSRFIQMLDEDDVFEFRKRHPGSYLVEVGYKDLVDGQLLERRIDGVQRAKEMLADWIVDPETRYKRSYTGDLDGLKGWIEREENRIESVQRAREALVRLIEDPEAGNFGSPDGDAIELKRWLTCLCDTAYRYWKELKNENSYGFRQYKKKHPKASFERYLKDLSASYVLAYTEAAASRDTEKLQKSLVRLYF